MRILISGAGIAGLTLCCRLASTGDHEIMLVEKRRTLDEDGYMIDFFASGYDVAERMGLLPALAAIHHPITRLAFLDACGREKFSLPYPAVRRLFDGRHFNFMRGELERVLRARLPGSVKLRLGTTVESLLSGDAIAHAGFSDGSAGIFDLVVGADGIHSGVRRLAFGEESEFARPLGYHTAAFLLPESALSLPGRDTFYTMTGRGKQVGVYPAAPGWLATFLVHRMSKRISDVTRQGVSRELRQVYGGMGGMVPAVLGHIDGPSLYFDEVSQIQMPSWSRGRVVLVGDACQCVSLLAGQGASLAMAGAFVLAEELSRPGAVLPSALDAYERRVKPGAERKQRAGRRVAHWFIPENRLGLAMQGWLTRMAVWPLAWRILKRSLAADSILGE